MFVERWERWRLEQVDRDQTCFVRHFAVLVRCVDPLSGEVSTFLVAGFPTKRPNKKRLAFLFIVVLVGLWFDQFQFCSKKPKVYPLTN